MKILIPKPLCFCMQRKCTRLTNKTRKYTECELFSGMDCTNYCYPHFKVCEHKILKEKLNWMEDTHIFHEFHESSPWKKLVHTLHTLGIVRCTEIWTPTHIFDSHFKSTVRCLRSRLVNRNILSVNEKTTGAWTWATSRPMKFWHKNTYCSIVMAVPMKIGKERWKNCSEGVKIRQKKHKWLPLCGYPPGSLQSNL